MHTSLKHVQEKQNPLQKTELYYIRKVHFFNLIWSLEVLLARFSTSVVVIPSFSFKAPSTGIVVEAKSCWKPWEATPLLDLQQPCSRILLVELRLFCRPLLTGKRRILGLHFFGRISNRKSHFTLSGREVWGSYGKRVVNIVNFPQLRRSLNLSSVKGFIPSLGAVNAAYNWDLYPKGFLGLSYPEVVTFLLSLIPSLLGLNPRLLDLSFGFFSLILKPLGLLQLFHEGCHLILRSLQLISGLAQALPLILGLPLRTL